MAQRIFWNWLDEDSTFDLSRWMIGIIEAGLYRGFDADAFGPELILTLTHTPTGAVRTNIDRTRSGLYGIVVTKQGCVVQQDDDVILAVSPVTVARQDLVVLEHEYKELAGGVAATVKIIAGTGSGIPELTNPNIQVPLGVLTLPENCTGLNQAGVSYVKSKLPAFANGADFIEKENGFFLTKLDGRSNRIINLGEPIEGKDATTKDYVDQAILNNVRFASEINRGIIEIADQGEVEAGEDDYRAITPLKLETKLLNRTATQAEANTDTSQRLFITPKTLANRFATDTRKGIARIATDAEVDDGTDNSTIVTPYQLSRFGGTSQKIVEIGSWDITSGSKIIAHTYPWWNKVVAMSYCIISDTGYNSFGEVEGSEIGIKLSSSEIELTSQSASPSTDFNASGGNRGYLVFWVKNTIVPPVSFISVSAGPDVTQTHRLLSYGTPVLNNVSVESNNGSYPSSLPKLKAGLTLGLNNNYGIMKMYGKRVNPATGNQWNNWIQFGGFDVNGNLTGTITDTGSSMDGKYYIKVVCELFGHVLESNTVQIDMLANSATGFTWNASGSPVTTVTPVTIQLNGNVDSVNSPVADQAWTVVSKPEGSVVVFGNSGSAITNMSGDTFGVYELKLSATNANAQSAEDTMIITLIEQPNAAPTAVAKWGDGTTSDKTVAWQTSNPYTGDWYGYYQAAVSASASSDSDGFIVGYHWQFNLNNGGWQDIDSGSQFFPNVVALSKVIQIDGNWKFRVRVKDNFGSISNWSADLVLNITGSANTVQPLSSFTLQTVSGGAGSFNTQQQLTIAPVSRVARLIITTDSYSSTGPYNATDFYLTIMGSSFRKFMVPAVGVERDITDIISSSMMISLDLNNTPPYKFTQISIKAYDSANNLIGSRSFSAGHL